MRLSLVVDVVVVAAVVAVAVVVGDVVALVVSPEVTATRDDVVLVFVTQRRNISLEIPS